MPDSLDIQCFQFLRRLGRLLRCRERRLPQPLFDVSQHGQARFGIVEHVPGFAAPGLDRFHVVLNADNGIGEPVGFPLCQPERSAGAEHRRHQVADPVHHFHGPRLVEHEQAGLDAVDQRRNIIESGRRCLRRNTLTDRFLDTRKVDNALAHDRLRHLAEFLVVFRRFLSIRRSSAS